MKVVLSKLNEPVVVHEVAEDLDALQALVGGPIELVALDPPYVAVVNEEAALRKLERNGPFLGDWFVAKLSSERPGELVGLSDEDVLTIMGTDGGEEVPQ